MNRYALLLTGAAAICSGGCIFAHQAAVEPVQIVEPEYWVREGLNVSPDGRCVNYLDRDWALHRIDLAADGQDKRLALPRPFRGEKIYHGIHVQDNVWFLALSRWNWDKKADGFDTRFVLYGYDADKTLADWAAHKDIASALAFAPKQDWLITAGDFSRDHTVCFWDRKTLKKVGEMDLVKELHLEAAGENGWIQMRQMVIDPTSSFLAFEFHGGTIRVWDMDKKSWCVVVEEVHPFSVLPLRFVDIDTLAFGYMDYHEKWHADVYDWKAAKLLFRVDLTGVCRTSPPLPTGASWP